jgi:hypothetical protein
MYTSSTRYPGAIFSSSYRVELSGSWSQQEDGRLGLGSAPILERAVLPVDAGQLPVGCSLMELHHHPGALPGIDTKL